MCFTIWKQSNWNAPLEIFPTSICLVLKCPGANFSAPYNPTHIHHNYDILFNSLVKDYDIGIVKAFMLIFQVDIEGMNYTSSKLSLAKEKPQMVRPMSRKDIFYSGSVVNLPEYQSQKSLTNYRQSVISIPRQGRTDVDGEKVERKFNLMHFNQRVHFASV